MLTPESVIPWLEGKPTVASILEQHQTDSARVAELEAQTPSALKAKLESAEARIAELERLVPDLSLLADEMDESGKKILRWVEGHAIPPGLNLHAHALRLSSLAAFLRR